MVFSLSLKASGSGMRKMRKIPQVMERMATMTVGHLSNLHVSAMRTPRMEVKRAIELQKPVAMHLRSR